MNTELYAELQRSGWTADKRHRVGGALVRDCEAELMELLRQTDALMRAREATLHADVRDAQAQAKLKQQEAQVKAALLDRTNKEVQMLKHKLRELERGSGNAASGYQQQVTTLQDELHRIKHEHERMRKQYSERSKEKTRATLELQARSDKLDHVSAQLEEYKQKCQDLEFERGRAQKQIESLESQNRTLSEKCELIQQQSCSYQNQLDRRRDLLDSTETSLRAQIAQLEGQLARCRENYNSQELELHKLRRLYDALVANHRSALSEKEHVEAELRRARTTARNLQSEVSQAQEKLLARYNQMSGNSQSQDDVKRLEQALADREADLQSMHLESTRDRLQLMEQLKSDISSSAELTKKQRAVEDRLRAQIAQLQADLEEIRSRLSSASATRDADAARDAKKEAAEAHRLKQQLESERQAHATELDALRRERDAATSSQPPPRGSASGAVTSTKAVAAERDRDDSLDRKIAELQVANAQLDALRLENRHLRQASLHMDGWDAAHAHKQLQCLETAYSSSLSALQQENQRLRADLDALRQQLQDVQSLQALRHAHQQEANKGSNSNAGETAPKEVFPPTQDVNGLSETHDSGAARVAELERTHQDVVERYKRRMRVLETEVAELERLLTQKNNVLKKLGLERDVMTQFVGNVDALLQQPPRREHSSALSSRSATPHVDSLDASRAVVRNGGVTPLDDADARSEQSPIPDRVVPDPPVFQADSVLEDSVEAVTARFLAEQEERTRQLEEKLNAHIDQLKANTEHIV